MSRRSLFLALLFALLALPLAAEKKPPTSQGKYKSWGPDIDEIEIVQPFHASDYTRIVVAPLDTTSTPKPEDADMVEMVGKVLAVSTEPFSEGVAKTRAAIAVTDVLPKDRAHTLIVKAKVTTMDPGSRSKRLWIGYGAGAARSAVSGELVDAKSGVVLVRFKQERRSGVERFGRGSSYEEIMRRNLVALGEDVAHIIDQF